MKVITNYQTTLSQNMTSTQTTVPVNSILTQDDHTIVDADFESLAYLVIEPGGENQEIVSVTAVTAGAGDSGTFTGATRGLAFYGTTASGVAANRKTHQAGSTVIMSNVNWYYQDLMDLSSDETVTGIKTFTQFMVKSGTLTPTTAAQFATKAYVDSVVGGLTNVNQVLIGGVAGETLAAGNLVYFKVADGRWWLTDADTAATVNGVMLGFAQGSATAGVSVNVLIAGQDLNQSGLTAGVVYYASNTAGGISSSTGTTTKVIGQALTTTSIILDPNFANLPTAGEKAAIAGNNTTIAVGSGNKLVTQTGLQNSAETYVVSTGSANGYLATYTPSPTALAAGQEFNFKANFTNTGAATLTILGLGSTAITFNGGALVAGDIQINQVANVVYNGTSFELQNPKNLVKKVAISTTSVPIASSTAENALVSMSLPGLVLNTNNGVRITMNMSVFQLSDTKTATIRLKYATTNVVALIVTNSAGGTLSGLGRIECLLLGNGATNAQVGSIHITTGNQSITTSGIHVVSTGEIGTGAVDSTTGQSLKVTVQFNNSSASDAATMDHYVVERIN